MKSCKLILPPYMISIHIWSNDIMLRAKPKVYVTMAGNQARVLSTPAHARSTVPEVHKWGRANWTCRRRAQFKESGSPLSKQARKLGC